MADDHFLQEFLDQGSVNKLEKKDSGDLLNSLFDVRPSKPAEPKSKPKKEQDVHEYLRMAERSSQKTKKIVDRIKQEKTSTAFEYKPKREPERTIPKLPPPKTIQTSSGGGEKKFYMPNIIDPFVKKEKDDGKDKSKKAGERSDKPKDKLKDRESREQKREKEEKANKLSKGAAKDEKIERKQQQKEREKRRQKEREEEREKERVKTSELSKNKKDTKVERPQRKEDRSIDRREKQQSKKKPRRTSSFSAQSQSEQGSRASGLIAEVDEEDNGDWRIELRKATGINFDDQKYKQRDRNQIIQSDYNRLQNEEKHSRKMGRLEEEEDLRLEEKLKKRRREKEKEKEKEKRKYRH